jgi:hypothetical protein
MDLIEYHIYFTIISKLSNSSMHFCNTLLLSSVGIKDPCPIARCFSCKLLVYLRCAFAFNDILITYQYKKKKKRIRRRKKKKRKEKERKKDPCPIAKLDDGYTSNHHLTPYAFIKNKNQWL